MNRFGAFAVHLGISLIIFVFLGYLILFHWYPDFFFASDGGWQGIRIVAFVDLVLGPTLTLVVYKKGKPSLRFDLSCIATLQAVCLIAGVWVVYSERPIAMVFSDGSFQSMTIDDYQLAGQPVPTFENLTGSSPYWIAVDLPDDPFEQAAIRQTAMQNKVPLRTLSAYYKAFDPSVIDPQRDGLRREELIGRDHLTPYLTEFFDKHGGALDDYVFIPFGTRYQLALIALHKTDRTLAFLAVPSGLTGS